jgi:N-acetylmuramic acid 6-phosphate etherase
MDQRDAQPVKPPDRGGLLTEQRNTASVALDTLSIEQCVALINDADATVAGAVRAASAAITSFVARVERGVRAGGRLVYLGAGTSGRLGVLDASECPPTFRVDPGLVVGIIAGGDGALRKSSEGMEDDPLGATSALDELGVGERDSVLGIAAGGTTPYVLGALRESKLRGATTGLLVCTPIGKPAEVDDLIVVETGPEVLTGSTRMKAGTATKLVLNTISTTLMVRMGKVHENLMVDLRATNAKLRDRAARIIGELTGLGRDEAFALLDRADGVVKTAVVMHVRGVGRTDAEQMLRDAGGVLRAGLETER